MRIGLAVLAVSTTATLVSADEKITITGCVVRTDNPSRSESLLVWSKNDILLSTVRIDPSKSVVGTTGADKPMFYWLNNDEDLSRHVGHQIQVIGDLDEDFDPGEIEINRKRDFIEIEFDFDGRDIKARVPNVMVSQWTPRDAKYDIVVRKVDVDEVKMLSASCPTR